MPYRTRTYIAGDWDGDQDAIDMLYQWKRSGRLSLDFIDAHELQQSRDGSLNCSIKKSLKGRMDRSKRFVLIVGDKTSEVRSGSCQYCSSYNSYTKRCARGYSVDYRSYIEYECDEAILADLDIVVLYNSPAVNRTKCPEAIRWSGEHVAMQCYKSGVLHWDYLAVRDVLMQ